MSASSRACEKYAVCSAGIVEATTTGSIRPPATIANVRPWWPTAVLQYVRTKCHRRLGVTPDLGNT